MIAFQLEHEAALRMGVLLVVFVAVAAVELFFPRRPQNIGRAQRWPHNLGIVVLNNLLLRWLFPISAVALAQLLEERRVGLLNSLDLPLALGLTIGVVLLDLAIYVQHVLFHRVPILWRLHRMHHADTEFDVTNGLRFHPVEILLSMLIKFAVIAALGPPAVAVLVFEVVLAGAAMFNHGNFRLPVPLDRFLRWLIVTPDMHRVHHSSIPRETHSNFGFNIPWWDRLFGTYIDQPASGHLTMQIGLPVFRDPAYGRIDKLLVQPLMRDPAAPAPPAD